jgi:hypothetical protein
VAIFLKRLLTYLIILAIAAVTVNDLGRYFEAKSGLYQLTARAVALSAEQAKRDSGNRDAIWRAAESLAQANGAEVYGFDLKNGQVYIWTRAEVRGTLLMQRAISYYDERDFRKPLQIQDEASALVQ